MSVDVSARDNVAMRVWDAFYKVMEELHTYVRGRGAGAFTHPQYKYFDAIAGWCLENNVDEEDYIRATASMLTLTGKRMLKIQDFAHADRFKHYLRVKSGNDGGDVEVRWQLQEVQLKSILERAPDLYPECVSPLIVLDTPFDAWFRVMYPEPPVASLLNMYGELAFDEIASNGALRRYLRSKRPTTLQILENQFHDIVD
jgi:hypothetical protein